jgi:Las17-binding protein actin regulator
MSTLCNSEIVLLAIVPTDVRAVRHQGMQKLLSSNFQIGADASAAAGPVGRHASAGTDWKLDTEILTYSRAKEGQIQNPLCTEKGVPRGPDPRSVVKWADRQDIILPEWRRLPSGSGRW